jgi:hypothetical protein
MFLRGKVAERRSERRRRSVVAAYLLAALIAANGRGAIVLDADFDQGSLNEAASFAAGNVVTLAGRDNFNPGLWKWLYFSAAGVAGQQVTFRIDDDFATGGGDLVGHTMAYSYDQESWSFFDNNVRSSSQNLYTFSNNQAFAQNQVYVAYGLPYPYARTVTHTAAIAASPWVQPTASANEGLIVGQSPGGIDDLGRTIAPKNLYGFKITDSASTAPKTRVALVGGVHANETLGNLTLEALVDWLLEDSLEANLVRKQTEFFVYPLANPDGRFAGYNRSTVQHEDDDPNRFWNPPSYGGLDDIRTIGEALREDTSADVDFLIDFHSDVAGMTGHYANVLPQWQSHPLWQNFLALEPTVDTNNALLEDFTAAKFGRDELGASFSITFETQFLPNENTDRFETLGRNWGQSLFRTLTVFADLDLDGALDGQDWLAFAASAETDLTGLSSTDAYLRGDLDGDGANGPLDFGLFKDAYEAAHGSGAFAAMLANVPEPASLAAAVAALVLLAGANRRRLSCYNRPLPSRSHATARPRCCRSSTP